MNKDDEESDVDIDDDDDDDLSEQINTTIAHSPNSVNEHDSNTIHSTGTTSPAKISASSTNPDTSTPSNYHADLEPEDKPHIVNTTTPAPHSPIPNTGDDSCAGENHDDDGYAAIDEEEDDEISSIKRQLCALDADYKEHQTEWFFLENQGCLMEYAAWKKICTSQLQRYLNTCTLEKLSLQRQYSRNQRKAAIKASNVNNNIAEHEVQIKKEPDSQVDVVDILKIEPIDEFDIRIEEIKTEITTEPDKKSEVKKPIAAHEAIVERAKQEAKVMHRIEELRKQGLWSLRRLPKIQEAVRPKVHWDYLLEEMEWLSSDFHHEAKFKISGSKKIAKLVMKYFQEKESQENRVEKDRIAKLQKISSKITKMVMEFWNNAGKVVEYKQQSRLELKRQKALDLHLTFIVDQTEKYSSWLSEGLGGVEATKEGLARGSGGGGLISGTSSCNTSRPASVTGSVSDFTTDTQSNNEDDEFRPTRIDVTDDEETIDKEEHLQESDSEEDELAALRAESELPIADILKDINRKASMESKEVGDGGNLDDPSSSSATSCSTATTTRPQASDQDVGQEQSRVSDDKVEDEDVNIEDIEDEANASFASDDPPSSSLTKKPTASTSAGIKKDNEFRLSDVDFDSEDDERTMKAEERLQQEQGNELDDLRNDGEMSIEELMNKYKNTDYDSDFENNLQRDSDSCSTDASMSEADDSQDEDEDGAEASNESETDFSDSNESDSNESDSDLDTSMVDDDMGTDCLVSHSNGGSDEDDDEDDYKLAEKKRKIETTDNENTCDSSSLDDKPEFKNISKTAQSIQPTGYTFETTKVSTPVPFLLRHSLREYQHVGLEWLATLYKRRLNGILADEMGLGKTIQTISLLAHLACEHMVWGPHLIVVPTSVMLNWEMEIKKWCPAFKVLTYYGSMKERRQKRQGWTKANAFHICITSYKLVIQDHQSFRRKKWKYFILDEAQNIKNFRSQRWQTLLNFQSQRRLLLTGTPLQNSLMELWSLMHFLMPQIFASHNEFKMWFANPVTGMVDGSTQYNEKLVRRLHKVLRPFLLRRLKKDVEKQMPQKYEHVVMCKLSKRQRYLYDDFMSQTKTKETLASGHFMSVINILMQLRKVCNHPNLFDPRPTISSFQMNDATTGGATNGITFKTSRNVLDIFNESPLETKKTNVVLPYSFSDLELNMTSFDSHQIKTLKVPKEFILKNRNNWTTVDGLSSENCLDATSEFQLPGNRRNGHSTDRTRDEDMDVDEVEGEDEGEGEDEDHHQHLDLAMQAQVSKEIEGEYHRLTEYDYDLMSEEQLDSAIYLCRQMNINNPPLSRILVINDEHKESSENTEHTQVTISEARKEDPLFIEEITMDRIRRKKERLARLALINDRHCFATEPVYGRDLRHLVDVKPSKNSFKRHFDPLKKFVNTPEEHLENLQDMLNRFMMFIPAVNACPISLHTSQPPQTHCNSAEHIEQSLHRSFKTALQPYHKLKVSQQLYCPEARLIQYDCGKLQTLDILLRRLKSEDHRVLIFTQMTKMLDVLEAFLNYHGYRYVRLDGTTKIEKRQYLMDLFNADTRIFVFILSTRSGGVGVNLTGADTVVFYDSDWNPTMDAQAQDRCHRIGQTRDVHIYRLVSSNTIEENILKKANQKRMLGNLAIEGGNFTTAFFKQNSLQDLFTEPSGIQELVTSTSTIEEFEANLKLEKESKMETSEASTSDEMTSSSSAEKPVNEEPKTSEPLSSDCDDDKKPLTQDIINSAMNAAEDESDREAGRTLQAEQKAELAEFDEDSDSDAENKENKVEKELSMLTKELSSIERYAVLYMEMEAALEDQDELDKAEEEVVFKKQEWELTRLQNLKEEEERQEQYEADEELLLIYNERVEAQVVKTKLEEANLASLNNNSYSNMLYTPPSMSVNARKKAKKTTPHVTTPKSATPKGKVGRPRKNPLTPQTTPNITTPAAIKSKPVNPYAIPYSKPAFRHLNLPGSGQPISSLNAVTHVSIPSRHGMSSQLIRKVYPAPPPDHKSPNKVQPQFHSKPKTNILVSKNNNKMRILGHANVKTNSNVYANKVVNPSIISMTNSDSNKNSNRVVQPQIIAGQVVPAPIVHSQSIQPNVLISQPSQHVQIKLRATSAKTMQPFKPAHLISRPSSTSVVVTRLNNPAHLITSQARSTSLQTSDKPVMRVQMRPSIRPSNSFMQQLNTANASLLQSSHSRKQPRSTNSTIRIVRSPAFPNKKPLNPIVVNKVQTHQQPHLRAVSKPKTAQIQTRFIKTQVLQQKPKQQQQQSLFPLLDTLTTTNMKIIKSPVIIKSSQASPCYVNTSPVIHSTAVPQNCAPNLFDRFANIRATSPIKVLPVVTMVPSPASLKPQLIPVALPSQYKIIRTLKSPQGIPQNINNQAGIHIVQSNSPRVSCQQKTIRIQPNSKPIQRVQHPPKH